MQRYGFSISPGLGEGLCEEPHGEWVLYAEAAAEIARLRKAIVWAVRHELHEVSTDGMLILDWTPDPDLAVGMVYDGTDESLIATVCRLAGEA